MAAAFPGSGTHLERYAAVFASVEINSSFYRPHRRTTYRRWADSVPAGFLFAVKLPKAITHEARLQDCAPLIERFAEEIDGLGDKLGPVLVQLPPSFVFPGDPAWRFFDDLETASIKAVVLESRHASWFEPGVLRMLEDRRIACVAADPAKPEAAAAPRGWSGIAYHRLHGSPHIYESAYDDGTIEDHAAYVAAFEAKGAEVWTIYDNTMHGAATRNAVQLLGLLDSRRSAVET
jgi:uncharacterized protein YecE (DUF72 family)